VSVMGNLGEHLALAVYLGPEGLMGFFRLSAEEEPGNVDLFLEVPQLQASFEDRQVLTDRDRQEIKALGLRFRGRQEWPHFRSYVPGYFPWHISAGEARFLTVALQQAHGIAGRIRQDPTLLEPPRPELFLVRTLGNEGWIDEWLEPAPVPVRLPPLLEEDSAAALQERLTRRYMKLEVDVYGLTKVRDRKGDRPYLAYHLLIVDRASGYILGADLLLADPSFEEMWVQIPKRIVDALARWGALPSEIRLGREKLFYYLEPIAGQLGIKINRPKRLPALERVRADFERMM
jgi:hypothetical protein